MALSGQTENKRKPNMSDQKNRLLTPLVIAAGLSVIAFSGIGVAAITGHLSITHSSLNPFSSFNNAPSSGIIQAPAIPTEGHQGLTRNRGETPIEGKPVNFQFGARVPARKLVCVDCGVVDSIMPGHASPAATGVVHSLASGSDAATILRAVGPANEEREGSRTSGFVVTVHMENGSVRTIYELERPSFDVGERIKLVNGSVIRLG
jgi:outer membrane lipoprotein SlyB